MSHPVEEALDEFLLNAERELNRIDPRVRTELEIKDGAYLVFGDYGDLSWRIYHNYRYGMSRREEHILNSELNIKQTAATRLEELRQKIAGESARERALIEKVISKTGPPKPRLRVSIAGLSEDSECWVFVQNNEGYTTRKTYRVGDLITEMRGDEPTTENEEAECLEEVARKKRVTELVQLHAGRPDPEEVLKKQPLMLRLAKRIEDREQRKERWYG